ncbi:MULTISPECIES: sensor histidine kinase [Burkholderia]|uniref:sensor histidine kinase n=1 Tax=Burkholderia TaxID=32008 RepID=UPI0008413087|nr:MULTISPECIES: HAMP domain-containing sensor histidine kinase [unclassified Burkholderia]AOK31396.1 histidine kinase [Burkholderia sp. Bp7605]
MTPSVVDPAKPGAALLHERAARFAAEVALFVRDHALSIASHDLRSPLNAMQSWAYVLERRLAPGDDSLQRALAGIRAGIEQQTALLEAIVDAPRAETRTLALKRASTPIAALVDECVALARAALGDARGTAIVIASRVQPDKALDCDRERIAQALWTMLTFAIDASAPGGEVTLAWETGADVMRFAVTFAAQPHALTDATLPHAFEAFARRDALAERHGKRPAAVFALCDRVARAHGGAFASDALASGMQTSIALTLPAPYK